MHGYKFAQIRAPNMICFVLHCFFDGVTGLELVIVFFQVL